MVNIDAVTYEVRTLIAGFREEARVHLAWARIDIRSGAWSTLWRNLELVAYYRDAIRRLNRSLRVARGEM